MTYSIRVSAGQVQRVLAGLQSYLQRSRFKVGHISEVFHHRKQVVEIRLHEIRLRVSKPYCGNHAGPCLLDQGRHARAKYLEGLDWISFNSMVNDLLDELNLEAEVGSVVCVVRKGSKRRITYGGNYSHRNIAWEKEGFDDDYQDCRRQPAPETEYVSGTPGIYGWQNQEE